MPDENKTHLEWALEYAAQGFHVLACHYVLRDGGCSCRKGDCGRIGKHPITKNGVLDATTDAAQIRSWWKATPRANLAIATGHDGLVVIDGDTGVDERDRRVKEGPENLAKLEEVNGKLPDTLMQRTGSGGVHYFFRSNKPIRNDNKGKVAPDVDVRGKSGYVVVPPSNHKSGGHYEWLNTADIAPLPEWLEALCPVDGAENKRPVNVAEDADKQKFDREDTLNKFTKDEVRQLMDVIPPEERDTWWKVGAALKTEYGEDGFEVWDEWSGKSTKYQANVQKVQWQSFRPGEISAGTIFHFAKEHGWRGFDATAAEKAAQETGRILITDRADKVLAQEVWKRLQPSAGQQPAFFRFGTGIARVRMVLDPHSASERASIEAMNENSLSQAVNRVLDFAKLNAKRKLVPANAPKSLVSYIKESLPEDFRLPLLIGTTQTPVMTADGALHDAPGYNPHTRLFHQPSLVLPPVPEAPSKREVAAACEQLEEVFCNMPFADASDKAHATALLILPFVRSLIHGDTPGHLLTKPVQGTGASLIAKAAMLLKTGSVGEPQNPPTDNEEWQKTLLSALLEAPDFCFFDDCAHLRSPALATVLTSGGMYKGRKLSTNDMLYVPVRTVWIFAGNNPTLSKDLHRRMIHIRLDAGMADPAKGREFKHPELIPWLAEARPNLIAAIFTLARAWIREGCPEPSTRRLASFEHWSKVIGGIFEVAGIPGLLQTPADREMLDEDELARIEFVQCWTAHRVQYPKDFTRPKASDLLKMAKGCELSITGTLRSPSAEGMAAEFVKNQLQKMRDRVFDVSEIMDGLPGKSSPRVLPVKVIFGGSGGNRYWTLEHCEGLLEGLRFDQLWQGHPCTFM